MKSINTSILLKMIEFGAKKIEENYEYINELNVFPVPDGDTGINLRSSIVGAFEQVKNSSNLPLYEFTKLFSRQLLMNSRGNSGVIFSQIFRGFFQPIVEGQEEILLEQIPECFEKAKELSYSRVVNPIEGTILTLIRVLSEEIKSISSTFNSIEDLFSYVNTRSFEIVDSTPDMLPALKESGVVDSGAYGLAIFFSGMFESLGNISEKDQLKKIKKKQTHTSKVSFIDSPERQDISEEGFGYCCEFICQLDYKLHPDQSKKTSFNYQNFENDLLKIGNSLVLVQDENLIKVHLHTFTPNKMLEIGQKYGEFIKIKIENMTEQFFEKNSNISRDELLKSMKLTNKVKIIVTSPSKKFGKFLKSELGVSTFIDTSETGNPSPTEFINKIDEVKSKNIIIIVDDSNVIMSAEQAIKLKESNINFLLIKTRNPLQLMSVLMTLNIDSDFKTNFKNANKTLLHTNTYSISTSVKTLKTKKNLHVQKGHYIGINEGEIQVSTDNLYTTTIESIKKMIGRVKPSIFYIMYGKGVSLSEVNKIEKYINENYGIECRKIYGDQKTYKFYLGWW